MKRSTRSISYEARAKLFFLLSASSLVLLSIYIGAIYLTVHNTSARQALESQASTLATRISELEFTAIALKNNVSLDLATTRGFAEVKNPIYISRTEGRALTLR